jgi:hypothetical protein
MNADKVRFELRVLPDGRLQARCSSPPIVVHARRIGELRAMIDASVQAELGRACPFALMVGGRRDPHQAPRPAASATPDIACAAI